MYMHLLFACVFILASKVRIKLDFPYNGTVTQYFSLDSSKFTDLNLPEYPIFSITFNPMYFTIFYRIMLLVREH